MFVGFNGCIDCQTRQQTMLLSFLKFLLDKCLKTMKYYQFISNLSSLDRHYTCPSFLWIQYNQQYQSSCISNVLNFSLLIMFHVSLNWLNFQHCSFIKHYGNNWNVNRILRIYVNKLAAVRGNSQYLIVSNCCESISKRHERLYCINVHKGLFLK